MDLQPVIDAILPGYALDPYGLHGVSHWTRVVENGKRLAPETGADLQVIELFAVFHDARRVNEEIDDGHGARGATLATELRGKCFEIDDERFELVLIACRAHTAGLTEGHPTVQTCWDADRLDIGRVGIIPDPDYLCTDPAKRPETLDWAYRRSIA